MSEQKLREDFIAALPNRLEGLEEAYAAWDGEGLPEESLELIHRLTHNLAGASAIYGFQPVSDAARSMEVLLREAIRDGVGVNTSNYEQLGELLNGVREQIRLACGG